MRSQVRVTAGRVTGDGSDPDRKSPPAGTWSRVLPRVRPDISHCQASGACFWSSSSSSSNHDDYPGGPAVSPALSLQLSRGPRRLLDPTAAVLSPLSSVPHHRLLVAAAACTPPPAAPHRGRFEATAACACVCYHRDPRFLLPAPVTRTRTICATRRAHRAG